MGIGPVPASKAALAAIGKTVKDMDVVEVRKVSERCRHILNELRSLLVVGKLCLNCVLCWLKILHRVCSQ